MFGDITPSGDTPPADYVAGLEAAAPGITRLVVESSQGASWADTLQRILPVIVATEQQRQILRVQLERARNGLPALAPADLGIGVSVGLSPETRHMLVIGGAAVLLALWFALRRGGGK